MESLHDSDQTPPPPLAVNSGEPEATPLIDTRDAPKEAERGSLITRIRGRLSESRRRLGNVSEAIGSDYRESEHRMGLIASGLGTAAVQVADRARLSVVIVPQVAVNVLEDTGSPWKAGAAAGASFAVWCGVVGGTTTEGLQQYPKGMESFKENYPGVVDFFKNGLPGVNDYNKDAKDTRSLPKRIGNRALTAWNRGWTVASIGTVAYVSTAAANGDSRKSTHTLNANASADGGAVVGGVVLGISEGISRISDPELAQDIINVASDSRLWYGIAGGIIAATYASNKWNQFRNRGKEDQKPVPELAQDSAEPELEQPRS